ncbi:MAG: Rid family hydrolase [Chloroflexi bacterium]|nr:Rid family hydrolase [Chloroflexota bacterium]
MAIRSRQVNPFTKWPRNVGCAAKRVDDLIFVGGQLPLDADDNIVGLGNVQEQARYALTKFNESVVAAGGTMDDVCEVWCYVTDSRFIEPVLEVGKEFFKGSKPTWGTVATTGLYKKAIQVAFNGTAVVGGQKKDINPGLEWYGKGPWDVAVPCKVANDLVFIGQMTGMDEKGKVVAPGDLLSQSRFAMKKMVECVKEAGGSSENIADIMLYCRDQRAQDTMFVATHDFMIKDPIAGPREGERYAGTSITQIGTFHPDLLGQYHAYAVLGDKKQIPLGKWIPYCFKYPLDIIWPAVKAGRYVFIAGQVMRDPKDTINDPSGELDIPGIKPQARFALYEMRQLLSFLGASVDNVATITAYHKDCRDMDQVLEVAHEFWHGNGPAWLSVGQTGLHVKQMLIEIYGIAIVDEDIYAPYGD